MKQMKLLSILSAGVLALLASSCQNQDVEFPDFDYSTAYFAYQYPVRTIVLGEDTYDTTLDNEHKCKVYAVLGGMYANGKRVTIDVAVDNSLCTNLYYDYTSATNNTPVQVMPSSYYTLASSQIVMDKTLSDGVEVQLTDAFFADAKALGNTYVIPLRMTGVNNVDSILSGYTKLVNPARTNEVAWIVQPKDYVLYCVKYINKWHANYLRRGTDVITKSGTSTTTVRHQKYVENDQVCSTKTRSLKVVEFPVTVKDKDSKDVTCTLLLTFDEAGKCTVSGDGVTATGTGEFVKKGDKKSWGDKDRDALYLNYQIDLADVRYATKDTLVVRDRGVGLETFIPTYVAN